jgi:hypothetical protein
MPLGGPRAPGTEEERAAVRRDKVRLNVKAFENDKGRSDRIPSRQQTRRKGSLLHRGSLATNNAPSEEECTRRHLALRGSSAVSLTTDSPHLLAEGAWSLQVPMRIDCGPAYQDAFIAALKY